MAYRLVLGYAFVRRKSEQNSSLQLLHGTAVEVLRFSSLGCSLDQFLCTRPCHVIGGDSDTSASIKRREFEPFALAACLATAVSTTKVIVTIGLAEIVASACESADMQIID
jgi:hypothetical protein